MTRHPNAAPPESVVIVRLSALGDTVHIMPLVASLRQAWPDTRIDWIVQPTTRALMAPHPDVDEFLVFDRSAGLRAFARLRRHLASRRWDLAIVPHTAIKAGLVTAMIRAPRKLGYDRARAPELNWLFTTESIAPRSPQHMQDEFIEFLDHLGVEPRMEWNFAFSEQERAAQREWFDRLDRPVLAVALHTSRPGKNWIAERYARVLEAAEGDFGFRTMIVGGVTPGEEALAAEVIERTRARPIDARADDVRRLAWLLDRSDLVLSPDTAPLHIAVALGTPTVGLYATTDPGRVGPYGRYRDLTVDRFGSDGSMNTIEVSDVMEKLHAAVDTYLSGPAE
ncbi:MAG: glycosyltransferase family 9 protein [Gemmatimonadota bacterium]